MKKIVKKPMKRPSSPAGGTGLLDGSGSNAQSEAPSANPAEIIEAGIQAFTSGDKEKALSLFNQALRLDPLNPFAWNDKGIVLRAMNRAQEALYCYDKATEIDPNYGEAWFNRGNVLVTLTRFMDAIESYDRALIIDKEDQEARENRAWCLNKLKSSDPVGYKKYLIRARAKKREELLRKRGVAVRGAEPSDEPLVVSRPDLVPTSNPPPTASAVRGPVTEQSAGVDPAIVDQLRHELQTQIERLEGERRRQEELLAEERRRQEVRIQETQEKLLQMFEARLRIFRQEMEERARVMEEQRQALEEEVQRLSGIIAEKEARLKQEQLRNELEAEMMSLEAEIASEFQFLGLDVREVSEGLGGMDVELARLAKEISTYDPEQARAHEARLEAELQEETQRLMDKQKMMVNAVEEERRFREEARRLEEELKRELEIEARRLEEELDKELGAGGFDLSFEE